MGTHITPSAADNPPDTWPVFIKKLVVNHKNTPYTIKITVHCPRPLAYEQEQYYNVFYSINDKAIEDKYLQFKQDQLQRLSPEMLFEKIPLIIEELKQHIESGAHLIENPTFKKVSQNLINLGFQQTDIATIVNNFEKHT